MLFRAFYKKFSTAVRMSVKSCRKLDESIIASGFLDSFDYVLTDCDGRLNDIAKLIFFLFPEDIYL